jgi:ADP-heptose:LPS heptosyltransferase
MVDRTRIRAWRLRTDPVTLLRRSDFRDGSRYAIGVASELMAPVLRHIARRMSRGEPAAPATWRNALIVGNGHIGDVLYRTCALDALAAGLPSCRWSYLTTELGSEVLDGNPALYDALPWMLHASPGSVPRPHFEALRTRQFDAVLCTEGVNHETALWLALKLGVPNRVAFVHKGLSGLTTFPVRLPHPMSRPAQFRELVAQVTGRSVEGPLRPRIYPTPSDHAVAEAEWRRLGYKNGTRVIACSITTRQAIGKTPALFFRDVLREIVSLDPAIHIVMCGTLDDGPTLRATADAVGPQARLSVGQLSVRAYAAFLERCLGFFGSDSGPRHLANAAGIPVTFVRNLGTSSVEAGAYAPGEYDAAPEGSEYLSDAAIAEALRCVNPRVVAQRVLQRASAPLAPRVGVMAV